MRFSHLIAFAILLVSLNSCTNKATKYFNKGKQKFDMEEFEFAAENMKQALEYGASKSQANFYAAESYRLSNRLAEAEPYYAAAIEAGTRDEHAYFYYAFALKAKGKYASAQKALKNYLKVGSNFEYIQRTKHELKNLKVLASLANKKQFYTVKNFEELNTDGIEYSPMMHNGDLYFTSSRGEGPMFPGQGTRFTDLFRWRFDGFTKHSGQAVPVSEIINLPHTHEASTAFSADGKIMIFSRSNSGKKNDMTQEVDLFESRFEGGVWTEPVRLEISGRNTWDSNPFLSPNGKKLFFSSNREGGYGGDDIWVSSRNEDGKWDFVQNLGKTINSEGNEQFPYIRSDGRFYFSSDGHPGYGGLDLYEILVTEDKKKVVRNLGKPINSSSDDFSITFSEKEIGFFSSNRPKGKGNDDIYFFDYNDITEDPCCQYFDSCCVLKLILNGQVKGKKVVNGAITEDQIILPYAQVVLSDSTGKQLATTQADSSGNFTFKLRAEQYYLIKAKKAGYVAREEIYSTFGKSMTPQQLMFQDEDVIVKTIIVLDPITKGLVLEFPPIYYNYNKWDIRDDAAQVLAQMEKVMRDNPTILVEIGSHTDARSTIDYNDKLSQKRAESVVNHLIKNGIANERLVAKGYGERIPLKIEYDLMGFTKGTVLTEEYLEKEVTDSLMRENGHQLNRRTEFKIIGEVAPIETPKEEISPNNKVILKEE